MSQHKIIGRVRIDGGERSRAAARMLVAFVACERVLASFFFGQQPLESESVAIEVWKIPSGAVIVPSYKREMNALFAWPGGKQQLKRQLMAVIPPHKAYVEVFCGSAKLLFAKKPSHWEIINDFNGDLINFFRVVRHRPAELAELVEQEWVAASRFREFRDLGNVPDELQRALRFLYTAWYSFSGKGEDFASPRIESMRSVRRPVRRSLEVVRDTFARCSRRLQNVLIENRDFAECIQRYDSADTFFYCDPPYTAFSRIARYKELGSQRQQELFALLARIKGRFLMSYDGSETVLRLARQHGFRVRRVNVRYSLNGAHPKSATEVIISNYKLRTDRRMAWLSTTKEVQGSHTQIKGASNEETDCS
ncbi:MAG TPA: DNA adenine methylase [Clostridia bacterium]|nr:DNA adenine methylase [Clostridia bacterium]